MNAFLDPALAVFAAVAFGVAGCLCCAASVVSRDDLFQRAFAMILGAAFLGAAGYFAGVADTLARLNG